MKNKTIENKYNKLKKSIPILLFFLFISCDSKTIAEFKVTNNTNFKIDSLLIRPNVSLIEKYVSIKPNETYIYKADMTTIPKCDGSYLLSYKIKSKHFKEGFGYYTNGYPCESGTEIKIEFDTIYYDFKHNNY
jgi:hypothetical protein